MKRTTLILLMVIYLLSCVGMGINRFYCCGKLASVTLTYGEDNSSKQVDKNKCCRHEKQSLKINDNHFNSTALSLSHPAPAIVPSFISLNNEAIVSLLHTKIVYKGNAPPGHSIIPVYTLNCTYRI
ncbi:HYC_CC_PP family protein [Mucilaginibacter sp. X5P1]|uniref:HYC_CC_PP family protein n=1 Tax=Mucilaginibacter sp. X5P1 TaxID=2723088 RepID=UPI00161E6B63|nr:hypothetical protein [Mucilaginibacter sp. X5P1]MBB6138083.1 hypothetical protein [Mucilaginibacter sp. X5P1]